ncbi:MAG TPA: hypothetical protein VNT99_01025 [Methylomirabilota bacterium]|nr:hypothetical protein [Methylomirabilota bacterium]
MPIRINLLAEAQAAEEQRRKDPVKRSIWVGGFLVFLVLLVSITLQFKIMAVRSEVSGLQQSWKSIEKQVQEVNDHRNKKNALEQKLSALDQFTTNRLLWANALDALQHTPIPDVQLIRVRTEQVFALNESAPGRGGESAAAKPQTVTERTLVTLEGKDYLNGDQVPKFKDAIANHAYFQSYLEKTNKVQLTSLSGPQTESGRTFREFGLQLFFQDKERHLYE